MLPLARGGFYVIAPDLRGYGRTTGWDGQFETNLSLFSVLNMVRDVVGLLSALGVRTAHVLGRDAGSPLAGWCALIRPDIFRTVTMMTAPFVAAPALPFGTALTSPEAPRVANIDTDLAALPRPRKHYQRYYATREADFNLRNCPQGLHAFFRAYWHYKSADWPGNKPSPLRALSAEEMSRMPSYYIMDLNKGMCETALEYMPDPKEVAACKWLTDAEVEVYASEYSRTGFQGALNYYRRSADASLNSQLQIYSGRTIDIPSCFVAGKSDWGVYQAYGALDTMRNKVCPKLDGPHFVDGAGHWVQEEQPEQVTNIALKFLQKHRA